MHASLVRIGLVVIGVMAIASASFAQNWPRFRGPPGSGIADSQPLPPNGTRRTARVLWKRPSQALVAEPGGVGRPRVPHHRDQHRREVIIQPEGRIDPSNDVAVHEWRVMALDKSTGRVVWSQTAHRGVPKRKRPLQATQANATAATDGRIGVVSFGSEGLYTYDMNGALLWKQDLGILDPGYAGQPDLSWGFATSPIIHGDLVILQCDIQKDSFMVAFNAKDGRQVWRTNRDEIPAWSTPVIYQGKTRTELVERLEVLPRLRSAVRQGAVAAARRHAGESAIAGGGERSVLSERRQSTRARCLRGTAVGDGRHLTGGRAGKGRARGVAEDARQPVYADADCL